MGKVEERCRLDFAGLWQKSLVYILCPLRINFSGGHYFFSLKRNSVVFQYIAVRRIRGSIDVISSHIGRRNQSVLRIGGTTMQVTKLTADQIGVAPKKHQYTQEEMQREYDYIRAEQLTRKLLNEGMIMEEEFDKIAALNRKSFSPFLSEIMP